MSTIVLASYDLRDRIMRDSKRRQREDRVLSVQDVGKCFGVQAAGIFHRYDVVMFEDSLDNRKAAAIQPGISCLRLILSSEPQRFADLEELVTNSPSEAYDTLLHRLI